MTKAEQIKYLEAQLKASRLELEKTTVALEEYKRREESFVIVDRTDEGVDERGYWAQIIVRSREARAGAGVFDLHGFVKSLEQLIKKWNIAAVEACEVKK